MIWIKRFFLFGLVNIAVMVMLSLVLNLLGVQPYLDARGVNYLSLMIFCLLWGTGGSFMSLSLSKWIAKRFYRLVILQPGTEYDSLLQMTHNIARSAGLPRMPEVGIFESQDINAFATGPSKSNSLIAVSTGLIEKMDRQEVEGVLAHEIAHIANGDMVTMTLIQGIINSFVMFLARVVASAIDNIISGDGEGEGLGFMGYVVTVFALDIIFGLLGTVITSYFSRLREFRADAGSARLVGRNKMIKALEALQADYQTMNKSQTTPMAALQISHKTKILSLLSTHPSLESRIAALRCL